MRAALRTLRFLAVAVRPLAHPLAAVPALLCTAAPVFAVEGVRMVVADPDSRAVPQPAAAAAAATTTTTAPAPAQRGAISVTVDRAKVVRLPERVQTVVLGNPSIADVAIQKSGVVVLTGKSYGVTNLIALDAAGNMLAEATVSVSAPTDSLITVQRGLERQSLSCTPACQPSVVLGDSNTYFSDVRGQADQHRQFSTQR